MSDIKDENMQLEGVDTPVESGLNEGDMIGNDVFVTEDDSFLTDDFKCGELLLDADEDREAFNLFLRVAVEEKRQDAIDKLLYIVLKNSHNAELLDNDTWEKVEKLSKKGKGYEYAYLLLHFKYYAKGGDEDNIIAFRYLEEYFKCFEKNRKVISPIAYLQKGICLEFGVGVPVEVVSGKEAMKYYKKALDRGCVYAYKYITCLYLFGAIDIKANLENAERKLKEGIKCFKDRFEKKDKSLKPFFEALGGCCFKFGLVEKMAGDGKELAQYMIDNNIKGGHYLMGSFYLYSNPDYNMEMAKNYFMEALKNNEVSAYGTLALINKIEKKKETAYKLAHKGYSENDSLSFTLLGQIYEELGEMEEDDNKAKKCYYKAWDYYEKAYNIFGVCSDNLGCLYLDKGIFTEGYSSEEMAQILEKGAKQLNPKAISCYLRLIQMINGQDSSTINYENANKLPNEYREKFHKYLEVGAKTGDVDLVVVYIKANFVDERTKAKLFKGVLDESYFLSGVQLESVYKYADKKTKAMVLEKLLKQSFILGDQLESIYKYADRTTKAEVTQKLLEQRFIAEDQFESVCKYADEETKMMVAELLLEVSSLNDDQIEFVYKCADEETKANLSKKLVDDTYSVSSKKQFVDIVEHYNEKQDDSFRFWFLDSLFKLFYVENENRFGEYTSELKDVIENSADENIKELWRDLLHKIGEADKNDVNKETSRQLLLRYLLSHIMHPKNEDFNKNENSSDEVLKSTVNFIDAIQNSKNEGLKKVIEKIGDEVRCFIDSCFAETISELFS